ncbi:MAG: deoxyribodipyrimidine photo-lyase, partial [Pseudomonadota bacterium]
MPTTDLSLQPLLADRSRALNAAPLRDGPIVYVMRTALRTAENPALEGAAAIAADRGAPAALIHVLAADEPFANDRRFRFALEGVGEVAAGAAARGFGFGLHLAPAGTLDAALAAIAAQAGAVVVEDHPLPFSRDPARRLAETAGCPVLAVDASCVAPMRMVEDDAVDRAFKFRKATKALYKARVPLEMTPAGRPAAAADPTAFGVALADHAQPVDALLAGMAIDHAVGPTPHTRGGMAAAQARWAAFRDGAGLAAYAAKRNDALIDGVSRLSPYLRWGMIAPFQVAREAQAKGGAGAEKFLDELLIWREMAWAWASRTSDPDDYDAVVPDWAQESFARRG